MTLDEFLELDEMEQAEAIWSGKHVGTRHEGEYRILPYKIDEFYVEAWYHVEYNVLRKFYAIVGASPAFVLWPHQQLNIVND